MRVKRSEDRTNGSVRLPFAFRLQGVTKASKPFTALPRHLGEMEHVPPTASASKDHA